MLGRSLLAAIALLVFVGGSAVARPGPITVVSKKKEVGPTKEAIAVARCDGEQKALGGGFKSAEGQGYHQAYPEVSRPFRDSGWKIQVANRSTTRSLQFRAYAICQRDPGSLRRVLESENAPDTAKPTPVVARCPGAQQVVGGGFAVGGEGADVNDPDGAVVRSYPFADEANSDWTVFFDPIGPGLTIKGIAVCRKQGPGITMKFKKGTVEPLSAKTVEVGCPAGRPQVVNGGFSSPSADFIPISSYPTRAGDAWKVTVFAAPAGSAKFHAFALCQ